MLNKIIYLLIFISTLTATSSIALSKISESKILLRENVPVQENSYYLRVLRAARNNSSQLESEKVLYLIDQLKFSPYQFERNGNLYDAEKAANHLRSKYQRFKKTDSFRAEDFIYQAASRSSASGKPYFLVDLGGNKHLFQEVLIRELKHLEEHLNS